MAGAFRLNLDNSIVAPSRARIKGAMEDLEAPLSAYDAERLEGELQSGNSDALVGIDVTEYGARQ